MANLRPRLAILGLLLLVAIAACLPGARAPNVVPGRTLAAGEGGGAAGAPSEGPFAVVFSGPKGETRDPSEITVVWNRAMRAMSLAGDEGPVPVRIEPTPKGDWRWLGTSAVAFMPEGALPRATRFKVTVPGSTKALDGSVLGADHTFELTTARPEVTSVTPSRVDVSRERLPLDATFDVRTNQPVALEALESATRLRVGVREVPFTLSRPKSDAETLARLTPKAKLAPNTPVEIEIDETLRGREGPLPSDASSVTSMHTFGPLQVKEVSCGQDARGVCSPHRNVYLRLSNRVKRKDFRAHVRVEPAAALPKRGSSTERDDDLVDWLYLPTDLPPASTVRVIVSAGLSDEHGQRLAKSHVTSVTVGDESPNVTVGVFGDILEAAKAKGREVSVAALNVPSYELLSGHLDEAGVMALRRIRRDGRGEARERASWSELSALPGLRARIVRPTGPRNLNALEKVGIGAALGGDRGALVVMTRRPGPRADRASIREERLVSVTDLGLSARVSRFGSLAFVTRLSDGKPVPGAIVAARDASGRELFSAKVDASGVAVIPPERLPAIDASGSIDPGVVLFARDPASGDWTFRAAEDTVMRADVPYTDLTGNLGTFGMLFADRGIYRAGETVRVKGVFRTPLARGLATPVGRELTLRASDADGNTLLERTVKLGAFGEFASEVPIAKTARLGPVTVTATTKGAKASDDAPIAASTSVEVAAYRPAEFKTAVEPDRPAYVRGDKATFTVRGDYLFGAPMSGGKVRVTATRHRTSFAPKGADDFVVSDEAYTWAHEETGARGGAIHRGDGTLDGKGTFDAQVPLTLPDQTGPEVVGLEADIEDLSRQTVASEASAIVHPAEFYVALARSKASFRKPGAPIEAKVAAIDPEGRHRGGVRIGVELLARTWQTVTEGAGEDVHYASRVVDKPAGRCEVTSADAVKPATCSVTPAHAGYFVLRATAKDRRGNPVAASEAVYVVGAGEARVAWPVYDGARLDLVTDKPSYAVGDTATILVKNPFAEAEALVTVERQGIYEQRRVTLRGPMPTLQVPVTDAMWPNVYVGVEIVKARTAPVKVDGVDVGAPSYRLGYADLAIDPEARRLEVAVSPTKRDLRPGEEIEVDLRVTGKDGKGARADVAFYAVDEGVLMLTGYQTPDPLGVFSAHRPLSVTPIATRDALGRLARLGSAPGVDKGDEGGGGGEGGSRMREDFRTTAYFAPSVVTGEDGKARVKFKLPDSLTTFRLMAVASATDHRFGFGEDRVTTSRKLMARPALPRFLRAGDRIEASVVLTSKMARAERVEVTLATKGVVLGGSAARVVDVPAGGSVEVRWPVSAPRAGRATFAFEARAKGERDAVTVDREVSVPLSLEAVALSGDTTKAVAEKLGDLGALRSDVGGLDLRVASTALVGLENGVEALLEYPYGCTEQLASKIVPLVALADLAKDYGIPLPKNGRALADEAIAKMLKSQHAEGGFGFWGDSPAPSAWVTAYAVWALSLAKERGHAVPEQALESSIRWLRDRVAECGMGDGRGRGRGLEGCEVALDAFVVDVLASVGKPDAGYTARLFEARARMPLFARALLAHAMVVAKLRLEDARELMRDVENHLRVTPTGAIVVENTGGSYAALLDSDARTTAMVLRALVTIDPAHPLAARIAKGLLGERRGGSWRTTQENAWALLALDAYRKAQEARPPNFDASVFFGQNEVFSAAFHGRTTKSKSASFPLAEIAGRGGEALAFQVDGEGRLFYEARLRYARKELPTAPLERGFFVTKTLRSVKPEQLREAMSVVPRSSQTSAVASDLVLVDLFVITTQPREQVVIDDPLPAGLEAVSSKLRTTASDLDVTEPGAEGDAMDAEEASDDDARANGRGFLSSWYHREMHDDRVLTFVDHMAAGAYHYRYLARATTLGTFIVPPTRAECMYEPESFGRTAASVFEVRAK